VCVRKSGSSSSRGFWSFLEHQDWDNAAAGKKQATLAIFIWKYVGVSIAVWPIVGILLLRAKQQNTFKCCISFSAAATGTRQSHRLASHMGQCWHYAILMTNKGTSIITSCNKQVGNHFSSNSRLPYLYRTNLSLTNHGFHTETFSDIQKWFQEQIWKIILVLVRLVGKIAHQGTYQRHLISF